MNVGDSSQSFLRGCSQVIILKLARIEFSIKKKEVNKISWPLRSLQSNFFLHAPNFKLT